MFAFLNHEGQLSRLRIVEATYPPPGMLHGKTIGRCVMRHTIVYILGIECSSEAQPGVAHLPLCRRKTG